MKKKLWLLAPVAFALTAASTGAQHWTNDQLIEAGKALPAKMAKVKVGTESVANWGNHSMTLAHREGDGLAELHETENDVIFIRGGEGGFVMGGKIPDGKPSAANEVRGSKIEGGEKFALHPGDVIHVPVKTPHQFLVEPGHKIDYVAIKVHQ